MKQKETHLFILWENAIYKKQEILAEIKEKFDIINVYEIEWSQEKFIENIIRFYGTNLPNAEEKAEHCGKGKFLLIIVNDENPIYEKRNTSTGEKVVNINMFDCKEMFRQMTGGGHKVHATNDEIETNHDITLLLDKNLKDYLKEITKEEEIISIKKDLFGAENWKSVNDMFYALNNCLNYAILRNYESLPDEIYVNGHNDIDIICDSYENAIYVLNAEKVFPEEYRIHYRTKVEDKYANFDLRHIGDNYYCKELEERILKNRVFNEKGFFTLNETDYFYTLLYHALIHKNEFKPDYKMRLINMMPDLIQNETTEDEMIEILKNWLKDNNYIAVKPIDQSVYYNIEHLKKMGTNMFRETNDDNINEEKALMDEIDISIIEENLEARNNILKWYNFKEDSDILEITTGLMNFEKKQYDYIILYDLKYIKDVKKYLKENGIILLIVDNKFSISAFAGAKPKYGNIYATIMEDDKKTFSKSSIEKELKQNGFENYKFYYPLPNYRMCNVIFSDEYMPNENTTKLMYNICYRNGSAVVFDELRALKQITKEGKFKDFANSYFIEINNKQKDQPKFVSFNNIRKAKYRLMTKIYDDYVEKDICSEQAEEHINKIERNSIELKKLGFNIIDEKRENHIYCKYINLDTLDKILAQKLLNKDIDGTYELIDKWYTCIKNKLIKDEPVELNENININSEKVNDLTIIKDGYIDIVFENIFLDNGDFILFDQEWYIERIPIEFILYRAINNLYVYNQEINKIFQYTEMLNKFNLTEYLEIFEKIEKYIQNIIIDDEMKKINQNSLEKLVDINEVAIAKKQLNDYKEDGIKKEEYIKQLEKQREELKAHIENVEKYLQDANKVNKEQGEYIKSLENEKIENSKIKNKIKRFFKGRK
ncbi:MAG: hypothetical protein HFJ55_06010 [Clostridia bacterium]|nr:hypothetical protein [Clostridia bacterium]